MPDAQYDAWKVKEQGAANSTSTVLPLAESLVSAGVILSATVGILVNAQRVPSGASHARSLTSDSFFEALQEKKGRDKAEAKEANRREREWKRAENRTTSTPVQTVPVTPSS